jgi:F-type H+-transporting ATPase subunit delta
MASEATTIARPYAEAVFGNAVDSGKLQAWSEMLSLLSGIVSDSQLAGIMTDRRLDGDQLTQLLLDLGGDGLSEAGQNFVKLLVENDRIAVLPDIAAMFERLRSEHEGAVDVVIESALDIDPTQEKVLAKALERKLGREVRLSSEPHPELIGGVRIRAGDLVIDGSVQGQLAKLAHLLGI